LRRAADAVGSEGGGGGESEEHAATAIARARIPDLTSVSPLFAGSTIVRLLLP
jgi:hypothetical protein